MIRFLRHFLGWILRTFGSRKDLVLENLALRQQLLALHAKRPRRRFSAMQRLFWLALRRLWTGWQKPLILVTPRTVAQWHRAATIAGFAALLCVSGEVYAEYER